MSLAVWIGGAVAELDLFRRASLVPRERDDTASITREQWKAVGVGPDQQARAEIYRRMLDKQRYTHVEIDILAGASAGGLNAVLMAVAMSFGYALDGPAHATWIGEGALWKLLRGPGFGRVESILDGDGVFLGTARATLDRIVLEGASTEYRPAADSITVELSATLLGGADPGSDRTAREHSHQSGFTFTRRAGGLDTNFSTIPQPGESYGEPGLKVDRAVSVLARAVRSTSSFPGAFEASRVRSVPEEAESSTGENAVRAFPLVSVRSDGGGPGYAPEFWRVVDGGVFDNIPIDRAVRAIRRAPASGPTERRLIYLDPSPPDAEVDGGDGDPGPASRAGYGGSSSSVSHLLEVGIKSLRLRMREESAREELEFLRRHNDEVMARRGRLEILAATIRAGTVPGVVSEESYKERRLAEDSRRLTETLTAPWDEVCVPPYAAIQLHALNAEAALYLQDDLRRVYCRPEARVRVNGDVQALIEALALLISWVQMIEDCADRARSPDGLGQLKLRLYRCLTIGLEARRLAVYRPLAGAIDRDGRLPDFAERIEQTWRDQSDLSVQLELDTFLELPDSRFYEVLGKWISAEVERSRVEVPSVPVAGQSPATVLVPAMWDVLGKAFNSLRDLEPGEWTDVGKRDVWDESVFAQLTSDRLGGWSILDVVRLVAVAGGAGATSMIRYHEITGNEPSEVLREELRDAAMRVWLARLLRTSPSRPQSALNDEVSRVVRHTLDNNGASTKLAGTALRNFGGFLDWRWRANDWRWGRMDAAAGIVRLLTGGRTETEEPDTCAKCHERDRRTISRLQTSILRQAETFVDANSMSWAQPHRPHSLGDLSPRYRFAIVSRIGTIVCRALWPIKRGPLHPIGILQRIGVFLLRALIVPLTLVADPLRLAMAVAVVLGGAAAVADVPATSAVPPVAGRQPDVDWEFVISLIPSVAFGVAAVVGFHTAWSISRSRSRLMTALGEGQRAWNGVGDPKQPANPFSVWLEALGDGRAWLAGLVATAVVQSGLAVWLVLRAMGEGRAVPTPELSGALVLVSVGATFALAQRLRSVRPARQGVDRWPRERRRRWGGAAGVFVVTAGALVVAQAAESGVITGIGQVFADLAWGLVVTSVVGGALAVLSVWGWTRKLAAVATVVGVVAVTVGLVLAAVMVCGWVVGSWVLWVPVLTWSLGLGLFLGALPVREEGYGEEPISAAQS